MNVGFNGIRKLVTRKSNSALKPFGSFEWRSLEITVNCNDGHARSQLAALSISLRLLAILLCI